MTDIVKKIKHFLIGLFCIIVPFLILMLILIIQENEIDLTDIITASYVASFGSLLIGGVCAFGAFENKNISLAIGFIVGAVTCFIICLLVETRLPHIL